MDIYTYVHPLDAKHMVLKQTALANHISGCALEVLVLRLTAEVRKQCGQEVVEVEAEADGSPS